MCDFGLRNISNKELTINTPDVVMNHKFGLLVNIPERKTENKDRVTKQRISKPLF